MNTKKLNRRNFLSIGSIAAAGVMTTTAYGLPMVLNSLPSVPQKNIEPKMRLFSNENPYGPSKEVQKVIAEQLHRVNRYSSYHQYDTNQLKSTIAKKNGLETSQILLGHGSFDILRMLTRAFGQTKNSLITPDLTFNVVGYFADKVFDHKHTKIPLTKSMDIDLAATKKAVTKETKLVFICNPNNPTGRLLNAADLKKFCLEVASKDCVVVIDEAYIDLVKPKDRLDTVKLLAEKHNVLIIRTFSKAYGMAGLRVGYAMGLPETIAQIMNQHHAYGGLITQLGVAAAITALQDDYHLDEYRKTNDKVRSYTEKELEKLGIEFIPSSTNFIFLNIKDIKRYRSDLKAFDIGPVGSPRNYPGWSRISIGTQKDMETYIAALKTMNWLIEK